MKQIKFLKLLICSLFFVANISNSVSAFDGTDTNPPIVVSMRLLTSTPSPTNELIAIEVITQDDKNWVKITGKPQIGYGFVVSNTNIAPNCATVTNSFSNFEVIEDENFRITSTSTAKKQRFYLIGYIPKPSVLPGNCPEYRNLAAMPAVVLNTSSFIKVVDKVTKATSLQSNILTPGIQDESGRSRAGSVYGGLAASNLTFLNQRVALTSQFCVSTSLSPKNNTSIANIQAKYLDQSIKALDAKVVFEKDPLIDFFEGQIANWTNLTNEFSSKTLESLTSCTTPLKAQQIIAAYQNTIKEIDNKIVLTQKTQLNLDCQSVNTEINKYLSLSQILRNSKIVAPEYVNYINLTKNLKLLDCNKVTTKVLGDSQSRILAIKQIPESQHLSWLNLFCADRELKKLKYEELLKGMKLRYKLVKQFEIWISNSSEFTKCDPTSMLVELNKYVEVTNEIIQSINETLIILQKLEKTREIVITIQCKFKNKSVNRMGKSPKCPNGYQEVKPTFNLVT